MLITGIEEITKTKYRIFVDNKFAFVLYKGELTRYHIVLQKEIGEEVYDTILNEVILKRAKLRALHLLNVMPRTEAGLFHKLEQNEYPQDVVKKVMDYVKSFGYVNDFSYACNFIESRKSKKSRSEIYAQLKGKELPKTVIEEAMEKSYQSEDALLAISEGLRKKHFNPEETDWNKRSKLIAYFVRKGFRYEDVKCVMYNFEEM